jgi:hypothetical protein
MKNHSKNPRYKELLALEDRKSEIWQAKRKNRIKLDEPYHRGYNHSLVPRHDIQNREDAWVFWAICELFVRSKYTRRQKPSTKEKKIGWNALQSYYPTVRKISEEEYNKYVPAIQKHFTPIEWDYRLEPEYKWTSFSFNKDDGYWNDTGNIKKVWKASRKGYQCTIPSFYFITKTEKNMVEYGYNVDELLEQELAEINDLLYRDFRHVNKWDKWSCGAPKHFREAVNKSKSAHNKRVLKRIVELDNSDDANRHNEEFVPFKRDAGWYWW